MKIALFAALALALSGLASPTLLAGPETVVLPEGYASTFLNYLTVDHVARKRVRRMYVNRQAHAVAQADQPLPDGTVLIMEDHEAKTDADGALMRDADGRLIALDPVTNIFVMEKNAAWDTANEDWDYAWYQADGSPRPEARFDGCFACHANRLDRDYTFTYWKFVADSAAR